MIELIGVGKRYGRGPLVVHDVDVEISPGTPLVIHGANGSGKSTLLRLVAGCFAPTHGRVVGRPSTVGYVPDRFPALLRMPAGAYLRHLGRVRPGNPRGATVSDVRSASSANPATLLSALGFRGGLDTPMNRLSKGNAQKVGLAQALCSGAALLVLDEPWSGLDTDARPALTAAVARLAAHGAAIVLTDHTRTAETLPDHQALLLRDGQLTTAGPRMVAIRLRRPRPRPRRGTPAGPRHRGAAARRPLPRRARWGRGHPVDRRPPVGLLRAGGAVMIGLVRYLGSDLLRSQRFLLPMLLYVGLLAPLLGGDPGPSPQQLGTVTRGWAQYFRHGSSNKAYHHLQHYLWWRVWEWLKNKHPRTSKREIIRRYYNRWWPEHNGVALWQPSTMTIQRYRYRGNRIPTPWDKPGIAPA